MHAVFLISITPSCKGITGDALITTITRKTGLACPGGIINPNESPEQALARKVKEEINHSVILPKHIYTGLVHDKQIGAFTDSVGVTVSSIINSGSAIGKYFPKDETINDLLISQADRQIKRWLVEALISAGLKIDTLSGYSWISCFGSGTLQYSLDCGNAVKSKSLYLHERSAFEFFDSECVSNSRITIGHSNAESDNPVWTESLWNTRKLRALSSLIRNKGSIAPQWIIISEDEKWEGLGLVIPINNLDLNWWPADHSAVIKFAEFKNGKWG